MIPGVFLGYDIQSGGRWSKSYIVANLADFKKGRKKPRINYVDTVYVNPHEGYIFPMKPMYDKERRTVGIADDELVNGIIMNSEPENWDRVKIKELGNSDDGGSTRDDGGRKTDQIIDESGEDDSDDSPEEGRDSGDQTKVNKKAKWWKSSDPETTYSDEWLGDPVEGSWTYRHVGHRWKTFVPGTEPKNMKTFPKTDVLDSVAVVHCVFSDGSTRQLQYN